MSPQKNKTKSAKKLRVSQEQELKSKLEHEAAELLLAAKNNEEKSAEVGMTQQQKKWREDLLIAIENDGKPAEPLKEPDKITAPAEVSESPLKHRLSLKRSKKHRYLLLPLITGLLYASIFLLRLDYIFPKLDKYLPWPAVYINGHIIWLDEVKAEAKILSAIDLNSNAEELAMQHLVDEQLISGKFNEYQLSIPTNQVNDQLKTLSQEFGSDEAFFQYLSYNYGMSANEFSSRVLKPYLRRLTIQQYLNNDPRAGSETIRLAQDVFDRIKAGEITFEQAAHQFSDDETSAANAGSLGWFTWGTMIPEFESTLRSLAKGEVSKPVKTDFGYHLLRLDETKGSIPSNGDIDETSGVLASHIYFKIADFNSWLDNMHGQAKIVRLARLK